MDYDAVVGGIFEPDVKTIISGGLEVVVGGAARGNATDRVLYMKHLGNDIKKLLAAIGMSRPVSFGNVEYDDGSNSHMNGVPEDNPASNEVLMSALHERLSRSIDDTIEGLIHDYRLREPLYLAFTELIQMLLRHIKTKRPRMKAIKVDGDVGDILDRVRRGDSYFKIATNKKQALAPKHMQGVVKELLAILQRERTPMGEWKKPKIKISKWPTLEPKIMNKLTKMSASIKAKSARPTTVRKYVEAIVLRENELTEHMNAIENYYIQSAKNITSFKAALNAFLRGACKTVHPKKTESDTLVVAKA